MTIAGPVRTRGHASTLARSRKKRRLIIATDSAKAVVKMKDVLDVTKTANSSHLSPKAVTVHEKLLLEMSTVCCVHTKAFRDLHDTHEHWGEEDLYKSENLLLCNLSYTILRKQDFQTSDHDLFNVKDMDPFCNFAEYVLKRGEHGHTFTSGV